MVADYPFHARKLFIGRAGLLAVAFGPAYSYILLRVVYGPRWAHSAAPEALGLYCMYILLLAANGVLEAHVHAAGNNADLARSNVALTVFSGTWSPSPPLSPSPSSSRRLPLSFSPSLPLSFAPSLALCFSASHPFPLSVFFTRALAPFSLFRSPSLSLLFSVPLTTAWEAICWGLNMPWS
jgi:hypothetical protein